MQGVVAATYTWDGGGADNNITTAQNWVGDVVPGSNSDIVWAGTTRLNVNIDAGGAGYSFTFDNTAGAFTLSGAASSLSSGIVNNSALGQTINIALTLTGAQTFNAASGNLTFGGSTLANGGFLLTVDGAQNTSINNVISGTGGITKTGAGTLTLSGANTYSGASTINGGTVVVNSAASLGASTSVLTLNAGTLAVATGFTTSRNIVVGNAAGTFQVNASQTYTASGILSGSGQLNKTGAGTMVLSGNNTFTGGTNVSAGTLQLGASNRLANAGALTVSGGTFALGTYLETVGTVTLSSGSITGSGTGALTGSAYALQSGSVTAILAGSANVTKTTAGTVTLSGANTLTGSTTVSNGTLTLAATSGSALGSTSSVTVNSGGTLLLGASNQINNSAGITLAGGTLAKGNFSEGATNAAGVGALTLTASGSHLDFGSGTVGILTFASFTPGANTLIIDNWTGTINQVGSASTDRLIFNASQASNLSSFSFTGYDPGATQFALGGGFYEVTPVPEPATSFAAALAVAGLIVHQRRRLRTFLVSVRCRRDL